MAYLTAEEYTTITGQAAPEDFAILESVAAEVVDRLTLYGYVGRDIASLPEFVRQKLKATVAFQVMHLDEQGLAGVNEPGMNSVSLGKFSYSGGNGSIGTENSNENQSQLMLTNVPFLVAYMRGVMKGEANS